MDLTAPSNWSSTDGSFTYADGVWTCEPWAFPGSGDFIYSGPAIPAPYTIVVDLEFFSEAGFWLEMAVYNSTLPVIETSEDPSGYALNVKHQFLFEETGSGGNFARFFLWPKYPGTIIHSIRTLEEALFWTKFNSQTEIA